MSGLNPLTGTDERGLGVRPAFAIPPAPAPAPRAGVLPVAAIAAACVIAAAIALIGNASADTVREILGAVACGVVLMLAAAVLAARAARRRVADQVRMARLVTQRGQIELQQMVDRLMRGEQPAPLVPAPARVADGDPFADLTMDLEQSQYHAGQAVLRVADKVFGGRSDQRVEIFVNVARRMQSLVHREIELLDELEGKVEDPELLKGLFTVDHLATRMRRQSESLAVLGGSASRRQWARQVTVHEVLRAAVAEVEQYSRVKVVPPVEGILRGGAVTDVIHLIAELVENATKFSAPHTTALLRAQHVSAGVAIEIEDRGLGMLPADQQRMNDLLADPSGIDVDELLRDGRIGLYVVATLARRHSIRVRMQNNIYGGTQAVVVLPKALLEPADRERGVHPGARTATPGNGTTAPEPTGRDAAGRDVAGRDATGRDGAGADTGDAAAADEAPGPRLELVPAAGGGSGDEGPGSGGSGNAGSGGGTGSGGTGSGGTGNGKAARPGGESSRPPLKTRRPSAQGAARPRQRAASTREDADEPARPALPKRQPQASFVPRPADDTASRGARTLTASSEPAAEQMTGLMANFLRGVSRAEEEEVENDSPAGD
jgi:signal transduction histidine kinase